MLIYVFIYLHCLFILFVYIKIFVNILGEGSADTGEPPCGFSDVTIELSPGVLDDLLQERVSAFNAYMEGLLVVSGDLRSAMRLGTLIDTINQKK